MTTCPHCGHARAATVDWGPLRVTDDPPAASWRGITIPGLRRGYVSLLRALAARGRASFEALLLACPGEETQFKTISVHIHYLRRLLPEGLRIEAIRGWGYELKER